MKALIVLSLSLLFTLPGYSATTKYIGGRLYATGFTGRAATCEQAQEKAEAAAKLYCNLIRLNYHCGDILEDDRGGNENRCAVRVMVELIRKKRR